MYCVCVRIWYLNACTLPHALWERRRRVSLRRMINAAKTSGTQRGRWRMITIIIPAKRKMTNSTSYCASPHFLNSSSRVRESWEKSHHLFKRIKSAGDRVGRNCSLDREFYAWHKWHEQSNLQPREILMWAISAARKGAERYARISSTSQPYPENVNDSGIAQLQLKDAYQCTYAIVACYYYFCFSRPHVFS